MEKTKSKLRTEMLELLERDMHTHEHYRFQDDVDDFEYNRLYRLYHNFEFDSLYCHRKELVVYHPDDLQAVCECDDCSFCYDCPALRLDNIYKLENKEGEMNKPTSCKYCHKSKECNMSYLRYIQNGTKHSCLYEKN